VRDRTRLRMTPVFCLVGALISSALRRGRKSWWLSPLYSVFCAEMRIAPSFAAMEASNCTVPPNDFFFFNFLCVRFCNSIIFGCRLALTLLRTEDRRQQLYQTVYCLWLLSYNNELAAQFSATEGLVKGIVEAIRKEEKEKIRRLGLATLRVGPPVLQRYLFIYFY